MHDLLDGVMHKSHCRILALLKSSICRSRTKHCLALPTFSRMKVPMPPVEASGFFNSYRPNFCSTVVNALSIPATISSMSLRWRSGRAQGQGVVEFTEGTRGLADDHARLARDHSVGDGFGDGFLRSAILNDFDIGKEALAAYVADDGMPCPSRPLSLR